MFDVDTVLVRVSALHATQESIQSAHGRLHGGFEDLRAELTRTLAEWGEGTESRLAFAGFQARVDALFAEMTGALAKMPPAIASAAASAEATEKANAARWAG